MICLQEPESLFKDHPVFPALTPTKDNACAFQWLPVWEKLSDRVPHCFEFESSPKQWGDWDALMVVHQSSESQFDQLVQLHSDTSIPDHLACLALEGTGFHGHHGRPWRALRGNIHLSTLHRISLPASSAAGLHALPTVSVCDSIEELTGHRPQIKWINDVLCQGFKVSGALIHSSFLGSTMDRLALGIGLNVEATPQLEADDFVHGAGSLKSLFPAWRGSFIETVECLMRCLFARLQRLLRFGPDDLIGQYRRDCFVIGRQVSVFPAQSLSMGEQAPLATGRIQDLDDNLALILEGQSDPVSSGRLILHE